MLVAVIFPNFYILSLNLTSDLGIAVWQGTGSHKCNVETIPDKIIFKCATQFSTILVSFPAFHMEASSEYCNGGIWKLKSKDLPKKFINLLWIICTQMASPIWHSIYWHYRNAWKLSRQQHRNLTGAMSINTGCLQCMLW